MTPLPFLQPFQEAGLVVLPPWLPFLSASLCPPPASLADTPRPVLRVSSFLRRSALRTSRKCWPSDTVCWSLLVFCHEPHQTGCYTDAQTTQTRPDSWWVCSSSYPPAGLLAIQANGEKLLSWDLERRFLANSWTCALWHFSHLLASPLL